MQYLFTPSCLKIVESLAFTKTLYAFDFDGTLAPIVPEPDRAKIPARTEDLIGELALLTEVVIISGRSVADLRKRVNVGHDRLIGNHGLEGLSAKRESINRAEETCGKWTTQIQKRWRLLQNDRGVFVENKRYSLALHYRLSRSKKEAQSQLFSIIEKLDPAPRVILGKCVMNLIPPGGPHKGIALLEAMMKLGRKCAFYIGDDDTDEDVFSLPDSRILTTRVCAKRTSQAQFYLKRQNEIDKLLRFLVKINRTPKGGGR